MDFFNLAAEIVRRHDELQRHGETGIERHWREQEQVPEISPEDEIQLHGMGARWEESSLTPPQK